MSSPESLHSQESRQPKPDSTHPESRLTLDQLSPDVKSLAINLSKQILAICRTHGIESTLDLTVESNLSQAVADSLQKVIDLLPEDPSLKKDAEHLIWLSKILTEAHEENKIPETEGVVFIDQSNPQLPTAWKAEDGWGIKKHVGEGILELDLAKLQLYYSLDQKKGKAPYRQELMNEFEINHIPVLNASALDYFLTHPEIIPEEWKTKSKIYFWNTIYHKGDMSYVRCLYWENQKWGWNYADSYWSHNHPAAILE